MRTAASVVVNRHALADVVLRTVRGGVLARELLAVEVVAIVGAVTKWLVARPATPTQEVRLRGLDLGALVIEDRDRSLHLERTAIQYADSLLVGPVEHRLLPFERVAESDPRH
jgi:hypothetical protein